MKKILIVGAGYEQVEMIIKAKERGLYVIVVDMNPDAMGFLYADESHIISTKDHVKILSLAQERKIDAISYMITETPMISVRTVCDELGLYGPSWESVRGSLNKGYMRDSFKRANIPNPNYRVVSNQEMLLAVKGELNYPFVIKPTNSAGQVGLYKVNNEQEFDSIFREINENKIDELIVEEFLDGFEVNVVAVVVKGRIELLTVSDRITESDAFGIAIRHLYPSRITYNEYVQIYSICEKIVQTLEIETAIIYPQMIVTKDGPYVVEIGERIPGGQMKEIFEYATGYNLVDIQLNISLNQQVILENKSNNYQSVTVKFLTTADGLKLGQLKEIKGIEDAREVEGVVNMDYFNKGNQTEICPLKTASDRFYFITVVGNSIDEVITKSNVAADKLTFIME